MDDFSTKEELIDACMASAHIPFFLNGMPGKSIGPPYQGAAGYQRYVSALSTAHSGRLTSNLYFVRLQMLFSWFHLTIALSNEDVTFPSMITVRGLAH